MAVNGKTIIKRASSFLGDNGSKFCTDYGMPFGNHWCCAFVWDIFRMCKASDLFYDGKKVAYVPAADLWLRANCKHVKMADARPGDIVIFTWDGNGSNSQVGSRDHIGFIREKGTSMIAYTIEGNTGGSDPKKTKVMNRTRERRWIYAIYRPNWIVEKKAKTVVQEAPKTDTKKPAEDEKTKKTKDTNETKKKPKTKNYLKDTAKGAETVYKAAVGCSHVLGTKVNTFKQMKKKKELNCNRAASFSLQLGGCLPEGKTIGHRKKGKSKTNIKKSMYGKGNLKNCTIHYINKKYKDLPKKYKAAGAVYIYDSNAAVSAGDGYIYSCNGGGGYSKVKKKYTKFEGGIKRKNKGYSFTHNILVVILPNSK